MFLVFVYSKIKRKLIKLIMNLNITSYNHNIKTNNNNLNTKMSFKALPTKVCGFCNPADVGVVLDSAMYQKHPNLILGLLISLQHYALKGLSLNDKKAGELIKLIREGSYQRNTPVKVACVTHFKQSDELLEHIRGIYENAFNGPKGLKETATRISNNFSVNLSKLLKGFDLFQIHDDMPVEQVEKFAKQFNKATDSVFQSPVPRIIKAIHVPKTGEQVDIKQLEDYALKYANSKYVDGLILDSSNLTTDQIGGTGLVNDWDVAHDLIKNIHKKTGKPVGLAGGLCPSNVEDAIKKVKPDFIDGNTGFRHDRADKPLSEKWNPLYPGLCPPKDGAAVTEILKVTADMPSTPFFDKYLT